MFDISWSELLIVGIVAVIFVGPKDLPVFHRTIGHYAGAVKRQVADVRAQFEVVMRGSELDQIHKEIGAVQSSVDTEIAGVKKAIGEQPAPISATQVTPQPSKTDSADYRDEASSNSRHASMPPMPTPPARH